MAKLRMVALAAIFGLVAFATAAGPVSAADDLTNVSCGGEAVEVCFPVCVTEPCYGYVCVHKYVQVCRQLGP